MSERAIGDLVRLARPFREGGERIVFGVGRRALQHHALAFEDIADQIARLEAKPLAHGFRNDRLRLGGELGDRGIHGKNVRRIAYRVNIRTRSRRSEPLASSGPNNYGGVAPTCPPERPGSPPGLFVWPLVRRHRATSCSCTCRSARSPRRSGLGPGSPT